MFHSSYVSISYHLWDIVTYVLKITKFLYPACVFFRPNGSDPVNFTAMFTNVKIIMIE